MRISALKFTANTISVSVPNVVLIVGPNNSGKSTAIRDIANWLNDITDQIIISDVEFSIPDRFTDLQEVMAPVLIDSEGRWRVRTGYADSDFGTDEAPRTYFANGSNYRSDDQNVKRYVIKPFFTKLSRENVLNILCTPRPVHRLDEPSHNIMHFLQKEKAIKARVQDLLFQAFKKYLVINPTRVNELVACLSDRRPDNDLQEYSFHEDALSFYKETTRLIDVGDGVKAYCGIVTAVAALWHTIIVADEPDMYLHPPLIRRLAHTLTDLIIEKDGSLVAATHSADFVMGCLESSTNVAIVRLTHGDSGSTARFLPQAEIVNLMKDPLTRAANALRGLFHECVTVAEGDSDRAFYEEINRRLNASKRGISDCLFLSANTWTAVFRIIHPLRVLGIPAAAIVDLDVLATADSWILRGYYRELNIPTSEHQALETQRSEIAAVLQASINSSTGVRPFKDIGVSAYTGDDKNRLVSFMSKISAYGLFIVPEGHLQGWLRSAIPGSIRKTAWLPKIFEAMGDDPKDSAYMQPASDDVWSFIDDISRWAADPNRQGMN